MESPSASGPRGHVLWQGLLLAVSLLTFWSPPTTAQLTVESVPPNAAEGKNVLLRVHNMPWNVTGYAWYKGQNVNSNYLITSYVIVVQKFFLGPLYSGREKLYPNGTLLIQSVTLNDTGYYCVMAIKEGFLNQEALGQLHVYQPVGRPSIRASNTTVTEHEDAVVLTCLTNDTGISILWLFNNQNLPHWKRMKLSQNNSTLTIYPVWREDTGDFQCEVFNPISSSKSDPLRLDVQYDSTLQPPGLSDGAIAGIGIGIGVLAGGALVAALGYFLYTRNTGGPSDQRNPTEHKPSASNHSRGHSDNSPNKMHEVTYSLLNFSGQKPTATEPVYAEVKK